VKTLAEYQRAIARRVWRWVSRHPPPPRAEGPRVAIPRERLEHHSGLWGREHPRAWEWPAYLDPAAAPWLATLRRLYASPLSFPASLSPEAGLLVHALVRNIRPRVVVETGTWIGISSIWIASALQANGDGGRLHTFDLFLPIRPDQWRDAELAEDRVGFVRRNFAEAGLEGVIEIHQGNSHANIRAMQAALAAASGNAGGGGRGGGVQLAYLDGDHGVEGACQDLWAVEPVLATGGYVLLHDIFPEYSGDEDGPRHILDRVNEIGAGVYDKCELCLSPANYGLAVMRRVG